MVPRVPTDPGVDSWFRRVSMFVVSGQSLVISTNVFIAFFNLIHLFSGRRKDHPSLDYHRPFADASPPENTRPKHLL